MVTTEVPEDDKPSSPLAQSPLAENSAGPSVPASREVKSRLKKYLTFPELLFLRNEELSVRLCAHVFFFFLNCVYMNVYTFKHKSKSDYLACCVHMRGWIKWEPSAGRGNTFVPGAALLKVVISLLTCLLDQCW